MKPAERTVRTWLREFLPEQDFAALEISHGGKHLHVHATSRRVHMPAPLTPSDHRWFLNWRSEFRRRWNNAQPASGLCIAA